MIHVPSFRYFIFSICCVIARTSWNPVLSPDMCWKYVSFSTWTDRLLTPASFKMVVTYELAGTTALRANKNHQWHQLKMWGTIKGTVHPKIKHTHIWWKLQCCLSVYCLSASCNSHLRGLPSLKYNGTRQNIACGALDDACDVVETDERKNMYVLLGWAVPLRLRPAYSSSYVKDSWSYLLYDPLLHHVRHDLEVDGPCDHVGRMSPEMRVSVRQNSFDLLNLKKKKKRT